MKPWMHKTISSWNTTLNHVAFLILNVKKKENVKKTYDTITVSLKTKQRGKNVS